MGWKGRPSGLPPTDNFWLRHWTVLARRCPYQLVDFADCDEPERLQSRRHCRRTAADTRPTS